MATKKFHYNADWQLNELQNWKFQITPTDLWASEGRFYYNETDDRLVIGRTSGDGRVAYLDDLFGLNKWKYDVRLASNTGENITLNWSATIDGVATADWDKVLLKNQTDETENGIYIVNHSGAWTRATDSDLADEIEWAMIIVEWGTPIDSGGNKGTLRRNLNADGTVTIGTTNIIYWQISLSVPFEDRFVKVSGTDTTEKYLSDAFNNAFVTTWPAIDNQDIVKIIHLDVGANETIALGVDMSNYTGDLWITWDLTVEGQTTLNDLNFAGPNNTVDRTNTTQTGTTTYDNSYDATYEGSTINHEWSTTNYDQDSTTNQGGETNYLSTSTTTWDQNFDENYTANYGGSTINYGYVPVLIGCSGDQAVSIGTPYTEAIDTDAEYAEVTVTYDQGGTDERSTTVTIDDTNSPLTVTDPWATFAWELTVERDSGNITTTKVSGSEDFVVNVCQYDANADWSETTINNDGTTTNNTNVTENYDSTFTSLGCSGAGSLPVDEAIQASATKADITIEYNDGATTETVVVTATETSPLITRTLLDGDFTVEWNTVSGNIEVRQTSWSWAWTATADVCQFSGGSIINNNGTLENNYNTVTNNDNTTTNNTNVDEYYDSNSTVTNEGDVYNSNLTVQNISYQENYVAGEALTKLQPLREWVVGLWEDPDKVYGANASDADHAGFIWFASKAVGVDEALAVLQGPRVSWFKAVYGALTDASEYKLQDDGTIGLAAWTVDVRLGDADGDDTLVGLNTPIPPAAQVPPKQIKANNTWSAGQVPVYVDEDTFTRGSASGAGTWFIEEFVTTASQTTITLSNTPAMPELVWLSSESGLYSKQWATRDYTVSGNTITLNTPADAWDVITVQGLTSIPNITPARTVVSTGATYTAQDQEYIVVTSGSDLEITLPAPSTTAKVQVKKLTGEDTSEITILPNGTELIDWNTNYVFSIDGSMITLTAVGGNRYIWD